MGACVRVLKLSGIVIVAAAFFLGSNGCGKSDSGGTPAGSSSSGAATQASAPDNSKIKLAGIVFQEDQFFRLVLFGMRHAATEAGVQFLEGNSDNKPDKEVDLISTYSIRGVNAIIISPLSQSGSVQALKTAHEKGISIIVSNTPLKADFYQAYIECSSDDLGQQTGKAAVAYIQKNLGGKAKIGIVAFKSQVPEQSNARVNGFKSQVTQLPGVQIVAEQDAWLPEMAIKTVGDMLTANPDINIIYAANEGGTTGAVLAVKNAGKAGKVAVFGTDCSQQLLDMLMAPDNILQAITSQRPVEVGEQSVAMAIKAVKGEPIEKTTIVKGILLSREDPAGVNTFSEQFKQWTSQGAQ
jgi:ABC-type sugar transport system substrate-binding protein